MDRRLIEEKLESLRSCVRRIELKCPQTSQSLLSDADLQDIIALNITRAVQLCVDIAAHIVAETDQQVPDTMSGLFDVLAENAVISPALSISMKNAVGFRNIALHSYQKPSLEVVRGILDENLGDFRGFCSALMGQGFSR